MKRLILIALLTSALGLAAIPTTTLWEANASATAANVNGGGFDPSATGMLTDLACTSATGNAPVCTSASYNFISTDENNWIYVQSGTNWTPGWYKIISTATNAATLDATIAHAEQVIAAQGRIKPSIVAGIATTASPTGGVFTIDYSRKTTAGLAITDAASVGSSTNLTSAGAGFTPVMVGNVVHITTTGTGAHCTIGWYAITSYTNTSTVVTDRTTNDGTACAAGTAKVGGAISLGSSTTSMTDSQFLAALTAGNSFYISAGSYTIGGTVAAGTAGGTQSPTSVIGYSTVRGDAPTGASRPTISTSTFTVSLAAQWDVYNTIWTEPANGAGNMLGLNTGAKIFNSKLVNLSGTAGKAALNLTGNFSLVMNCEIVSLRGPAINTVTTTYIEGSYIHGSDTGITQTTAALTVVNSILEDHATAAININGANASAPIFINDTFYGSENKQGIGISLLTGTTNVRMMNSIVYGFATGISAADTNSIMFSRYNDFYNNTADVSSTAVWKEGPNSLALNPTFTSVGQYTGTTATSSTNVLTDSGANFASVVDNQDECFIVSGTGTGVPALTHFMITGHTPTTLTLSSNITSSGSGSAITYQVTYGHNLSIGTNLNAQGFPGVFPGGPTGYISMGAVQRNGSGTSTVTVAY